MPAFEHQLPAADRWAVALYASVLRLPPPSGEVPASLRAFPVTGKMSDAAILASLGMGDSAGPAVLARVAAVRSVGGADAAMTAQVFRDGSRPGRLGLRDGANRRSCRTDASLRRVHDLRAGGAVRPGQAPGSSLRRSRRASPRCAPAPRAGPRAAELDGIRAGLRRGPGKGRAGSWATTLSPLNLFFQSFVILLREGLEAILVLGALMAFLVKMGAAHRKRDIHIGVGAAVVASLLTALVLETVFQLTPGQARGDSKGATMLVATGVLFYVSYWLLSKMEVAKWNQFVQGKVQDARDERLRPGARFGRVPRGVPRGVRDGAVLQGAVRGRRHRRRPMPVRSSPASCSAAVVLVGVYVAINRFGRAAPAQAVLRRHQRVPLLHGVRLRGQGRGGAPGGTGSSPTTIVAWAPRIPALGIYPTVESLAAQGVLLVLLLAALVWTFVLEPRRLKVTSVLVPEPASSRRPASVPGAAASAPIAPSTRVELLRLARADGGGPGRAQGGGGPDAESAPGAPVGGGPAGIMSEIDRLIDELRRDQQADPWHGPSARQVLEGVTAAAAAARPIPGAHSIWGLALHIIAWRNEVARRVDGGEPAEPAEGDWPAVTDTSDAAWDRTRARMEESYDRLSARSAGWRRQAGEPVSRTRDPGAGSRTTSRCTGSPSTTRITWGRCPCSSARSCGASNTNGPPKSAGRSCKEW